jgi:tetratricopeptide (TPR) repeat protein
LDRRRLIVTALALALGSAVSPAGSALAQPPPAGGDQEATTSESDMDDERARGAFRLGRQYYESGQFAQAAAEFERAYGLSGRGQLLYNAYLAYRDAQDEANAARTLRGYLAHVPDAPDRAHLEARLAALEQQLAERAEEDARHQAERDEIQRQADEARRQAEEAGRPRYREIPGEVWPWAILGVGAAMAVGGGISGGIALSERSSLDAQCPAQLCPAGSDAAGRMANVQTLAITSDVLLFGGGAVALTGLVLGIVLGPRTEAIPPSAPPVTAGCTGDGCFIGVRGEL